MQKLFKSEVFIIILLCMVNGFFLWYAMSNLSISYYEADMFFNQKNIVSFIANLSCKIFGQNDYSLRVPFIIIHFANIALLYKVSKTMLKRRFDRVVCVMLYMCLPGVMASAILANVAGIIIFFTLLIVYFEENSMKIPLYITLIITVFIDKSFLMLYSSLLFYSSYYKKKDLFFISAILFAVSIMFYDFDIEGKPKSFFLDTIGVFASVFSPFMFLFFIYAIYRIWIKERKNILWFITVSTFCICFVLSLRQHLKLEDFLPFCVISMPLIIRVFFNSYRVRLPEFRKVHKFTAFFTVVFLFLNSITIIFNQSLYPVFFSQKPSKHFVYKFDVAKDLSNILKENEIYEINSFDEKLLLRLKFYNINRGGQVFLQEEKPEIDSKEFIIVKYGIIIAKFYLS